MKRIKIKDKLILVMIGIIFFAFLGIDLLNRKVMPKLMEYTKIEADKLGTLIINDAISKKVVEELNVDELFIITRDSNGEIISIDFDTVLVNKLLTTATHQVELSLKYLETDKIDSIDLPSNIVLTRDEGEGIFFEVPSGIIFSNSFLSNLGPKIPVKLNLVGSVISGVSTKVTNYGINNALIELYLDLEVNLKVILPFISDDIKVKTSIPIAIKMLKGKVPEYYLNGYLNNPINLGNS